jgi:outer membrane lipoprotein-sorting protein
MQRIVLFVIVFAINSGIFASANDSTAYMKFVDDAFKKADSIRTLSTVIKTKTELSMSVQVNTPAFIDSTISKLWVVYPDRFRTEAVVLGKKMTTIGNGEKLVVLSDSGSLPKEMPNIAQNDAGVLVNTKKLLDNLSGSSKFTVDNGDTTATLEGEFTFNGKRTPSVMQCDLKKARIVSIVQNVPGGKMEMKIGYTAINGHDCINKIKITGKMAATVMKVTISFDSLRINRALPDSLFAVAAGGK